MSYTLNPDVPSPPTSARPGSCPWPRTSRHRACRRVQSHGGGAASRNGHGGLSWRRPRDSMFNREPDPAGSCRTSRNRGCRPGGSSRTAHQPVLIPEHELPGLDRPGFSCTVPITPRVTTHTIILITLRFDRSESLLTLPGAPLKGHQPSLEFPEFQFPHVHAPVTMPQGIDPGRSLFATTAPRRRHRRKMPRHQLAFIPGRCELHLEWWPPRERHAGALPPTPRRPTTAPLPTGRRP